MKFLLGSSSSFRREIFKLYFPETEVIFASPDIDERAIRSDDPRDLVAKIAEAKLDDGILKKYPDLIKQVDVILTLDQVVVFRGKVRGKPVSEHQAREFLESYQNGEDIQCVNGIVCFHVASGRRICKVDESSLNFKPFPDKVIDEMIKSQVVFKTAGAFCIVGSAISQYVNQIKGEVTSIEGLPVLALKDIVNEVCQDQGALNIKTLGNIKMVIFDMDGLLLNTETFYSIAQQQILDRFGIKFSWEVKSMMMGRKALDAVKIMIEHYGLQDQLKPEEFVKEREEILDKLFPDSELLPGVERLLLHLHKCQIPMAIATSSHQRHFDLKTKKHIELFKRVFNSNIITGDQVSNSKPHPEIFLKAFESLSSSRGIMLDHSQVLVFEDATSGIQAGQEAGMKTVLVSEMPSGKSCRPDLELKSLLQFLPEQWGLPPFDISS